MSDPRRIVAYSDLLGFSELVVKKPESAKQLLSEFYNYAHNIKGFESYKDLELFLFSDFLLVQGESVAQVVNYMCQLYRDALRYSEYHEHSMLIRGGVARGGVFRQHRDQTLQVTKNFIVSPALTHAVKMESLVKGQRLLISGNEKEELYHFWNSDIKAKCYDQPSIKPSELFKKYSYQDLLWGHDLSRSKACSRQETMKLINVSEKLYCQNINNAKGIVAHYAETLRICLLSYCSLLELCIEDIEFISHFVNETLVPYPNATLWLGFLECVLLSKDSKMFYRQPAMISFIKHAVLAKEWGEVSASLGKPEHAQLRDVVEEFIRTTMG